MDGKLSIYQNTYDQKGEEPELTEKRTEHEDYNRHFRNRRKKD